MDTSKTTEEEIVMRIYKKDVLTVLAVLETELYGVPAINTSDLFIVQRMQSLFTEILLQKWEPHDQVSKGSFSLLIDSYTLLKTKGYYYTDEE